MFKSSSQSVKHFWARVIDFHCFLFGSFRCLHILSLSRAFLNNPTRSLLLRLIFCGRSRYSHWHRSLKLWFHFFRESFKGRWLLPLQLKSTLVLLRTCKILFRRDWRRFGICDGASGVLLLVIS